MKNYDFNDFLKAIRHLSEQDKIDTAKQKLEELTNSKTLAKKPEVLQMKEKVQTYLNSLN